MGGAQNHRMRLDDPAMIKDNHIAVAGSVGEAVRRALSAGIAEVIVEVDRPAQIEPALDAGATRLLLDHMDAPTLARAVAQVAGRVPPESNGGVRLATIRALAQPRAHHISVVRLHQPTPAADIGPEFTTAYS